MKIGRETFCECLYNFGFNMWLLEDLIKEIFSLCYFITNTVFYVNWQNIQGSITQSPVNDTIVDQTSWNFVWCNGLDQSFITQNSKRLRQLHLSFSKDFLDNLYGQNDW